MNKNILFTLSLVSCASFADIVDPVCPLPTAAPCGVAEVISCARAAYNATGPVTPITSNTDFYNKQLFDLANQDGFCNFPGAGYPPGVLANSLQSIYFDQFCGSEKGTYFSYANFLAAAEVQNNTLVPAFGGAGGFACSQSASSVAANTLQSNLEVANFFASEAQETTSAMKGYTTDGLYFRYENGALLDSQGNVCSGLSCQTAYFPPSTPVANYVGVNVSSVGDVSATQTFTPYLWLLSYQEPTKSSYYLQYNLANSPMLIPASLPAVNLVPQQLAAVGAPGSVTNVLNINDPSVLNAGMYVGMGSLQLTGSSMYFFYGWYYNNLVIATALANFSNFIGNPASSIPTTDTGFLRQGQMAFEGAFWYWMYRSIGRNFTGVGTAGMFPSLHQLAMDPTRPACHCVGAVTLGINGGCNHFSYRAQYANYFMGQKALGVVLPKDYCVQTVTLPSGRVSTINGAKCTLIGEQKLDQATQDLLDYCQNPLS
jgi:hypothetical protein